MKNIVNNTMNLQVGGYEDNISSKTQKTKGRWQKIPEKLRMLQGFPVSLYVKHSYILHPITIMGRKPRETRNVILCQSIFNGKQTPLKMHLFCSKLQLTYPKNNKLYTTKEIWSLSSQANIINQQELL